MKLMMIAGGIAAALAFAAPPAAGEAPAPGAYRFADKASLDRRIEDLRRDYGAAAVATVASRGGQSLYEGVFGYADRESATPATVDTVFAMASVTKPLTATAIMMLVDEGKVSLDAPVNRYLGDDGVRVTFGDADEVTVERVMRHTAGLPLFYDLIYEGSGETVIDFSEMMRRHGYTVFPPGGRSEYSNLGYEILAEIVRRQSGMGYGEFLQQRIFAPLGMDSAFIAEGFERPAGVATPYGKNGERIPWVDTAHPGAAMAHMSVRDMRRFGEFINRAWRGESPLLSQAAARRMTTPIEGEASNAGLGFFFEDYKGWQGVGHGGSMAGTKTRLHLFPEQDYVFAVATNLKDSWLEAFLLDEMLRSFVPDHAFYYPVVKVPEALVGTKWSGTIGANEVLASVNLDFTDPARPLATVGGRRMAVRSLAHGERFVFRLDGELKAAGIDHPHDLRFNLLAEGEGYIGEVRAEQRSVVAKDEGGIGYWVRLSPAR